MFLLFGVVGQQGVLSQRVVLSKGRVPCQGAGGRGLDPGGKLLEAGMLGIEGARFVERLTCVLWQVLFERDGCAEHAPLRAPVPHADFEALPFLSRRVRLWHG